MTFNYKDVFVALGAIEFEGLVKFYSVLLEQQPDPFIPHAYAEFKLSGLRIGIFSPKKSHQSEFSDSAKSGMSLCFEVENIQAAIAHLRDMGYQPPGEIITASHGQEIYAYDPDGNRLIIHQSR